MLFDFRQFIDISDNRNGYSWGKVVVIKKGNATVELYNLID